MSTLDQVKKYNFIISEIVNGYFLADQKLALLRPLIKDKEIYKKWDRTPGVVGAEALRLTLYMAVLSDIRSILFDTDSRSASLDGVVEALKNSHFVNRIRTKFCEPPDVGISFQDNEEDSQSFLKEQIRKLHEKEAGENFDRILSKTITSFDLLKSSDLAKRVGNARSKIISHKEIRTVGGERALYNPSDFGLMWDDAEEIIKEAKQIIFDCYLLIHNGYYDIDSFSDNHIEVAESFWSIVKSA